MSRKTHGACINYASTSEYLAWEKMKSRCYNRNFNHYKNYGGRGIKVCPRWRDSFENFLKDMGLKPTPKHSLERKNNNGHYEPGNCVWATQKEQTRNTRRTTQLTYRGVTKSLPDWADEYGLLRHTLYCRVFVYGWTVERALTTSAKEREHG